MTVRLHCQVPVLSSAVGCLGVAGASVLCGQVARRSDHYFRTRRSPLGPVVTWREMAADALIGVAGFKASHTGRGAGAPGHPALDLRRPRASPADRGSRMGAGARRPLPFAAAQRRPLPGRIGQEIPAGKARAAPLPDLPVVTPLPTLMPGQGAELRVTGREGAARGDLPGGRLPPLRQAQGKRIRPPV